MGTKLELWAGEEGLSRLFERYSDGTVISIPGIFGAGPDEGLIGALPSGFFNEDILRLPIDYTDLNEAMAFADRVNANFEYHLAMLEAQGYAIKPL